MRCLFTGAKVQRASLGETDTPGEKLSFFSLANFSIFMLHFEELYVKIPSL